MKVPSFTSYERRRAQLFRTNCAARRTRKSIVAVAISAVPWEWITGLSLPQMNCHEDQACARYKIDCTCKPKAVVARYACRSRCVSEAWQVLCFVLPRG